MSKLSCTDRIISHYNRSDRCMSKLDIDRYKGNCVIGIIEDDEAVDGLCFLVLNKDGFSKVPFNALKNEKF